MVEVAMSTWRPHTECSCRKCGSAITHPEHLARYAEQARAELERKASMKLQSPQAVAEADPVVQARLEVWHRRLQARSKARLARSFAKRLDAAQRAQDARSKGDWLNQPLVVNCTHGTGGDSR